MSENVGEVLSCGWIGSFGSGKVASNGEMDESCCHSQDQPNAKRKRNVSSWKNPHVEKRIVRSGNGEEMVECDEEDVVHYRAKRGQATSSHSLAERMRRERISERMRLLQSLVPGCDKVTGKAVVLGEIINYVQSLQQQVEFLSMKLADVNQELNVGIEQILPKDLLDPQGSNGIDTNSTRSILETSHGKICTSPLLPQGLEVRSIMHNLWQNELQSILHTSSLQENGDFYNQIDH